MTLTWRPGVETLDGDTARRSLTAPLVDVDLLLAMPRPKVMTRLWAPLDDASRSMLLFPTFPTDKWDVRFKMHAPLNTTIEASCQKGVLEYLIVTPPERKKDITVHNCKAASDDQ